MTRAIFRGPLDLHAFQRLGAVGFYALPLVIVECVQYAKNDLDFWRQAPVGVQTLFYLFCIYSIFLFGAFRGAAFIYFQF